MTSGKASAIVAALWTIVVLLVILTFAVGNASRSAHADAHDQLVVTCATETDCTPPPCERP